VLELKDVSKRYADVAALSECSFQVHPGRLTGFVGPNGAGKTICDACGVRARRAGRRDGVLAGLCRTAAHQPQPCGA